jgi:hypothetical protein
VEERGEGQRGSGKRRAKLRRARGAVKSGVGAAEPQKNGRRGGEVLTGSSRGAEGGRLKMRTFVKFFRNAGTSL